uniref:Integrase core domain containing protein n=1 Tax=Solanum tuberosum TaxID=4113 RepID=M1D967_SOLTU
MPSVVDVEIRKEDDVVEVRGESENATEKEAEISQKVVSIPRPLPPFPQRLEKKIEIGKYRRFITMLKQLSINVPLIKVLELMPGYAKFMKDMVTKKRVESGVEVQIKERLGIEALATVMMNFYSDGIEEYDELVAALDRCEYRSKPKKYELDMKNRTMIPNKKVIINRGRLKLVAPTLRFIDEDTDRQRDPNYLLTPARTARNQSKKVLLDVVTPSQSNEEDTLIGSLTRSGSGSTTGSSTHEVAASSDEASRSDGIHIPQNDQPDPVDGDPNMWYVEGQWQIYRDAKMKNAKEKMARTITEERKVLTESLHTMPDIHQLFQRYKCKWMARDPGTYSEEIVRELYASYAATLRGKIHKNAKPASQDPFTSIMVRGVSVNLSHTTINRFLYGPNPHHTWADSTIEFYYRWEILRT